MNCNRNKFPDALYENGDNVISSSSFSNISLLRQTSLSYYNICKVKAGMRAIFCGRNFALTWNKWTRLIFCFLKCSLYVTFFRINIKKGRWLNFVHIKLHYRILVGSEKAINIKYIEYFYLVYLQFKLNCWFWSYAFIYDLHWEIFNLYSI